MFDKDKFSELIIRARGDRNNKEYAEISNVSRAYVSGYVNKSIENPPTPDIIKRLVDKAQNGVTYEDLMGAAGHLDTRNVYVDNNGNEYVDHLTAEEIAEHAIKTIIQKYESEGKKISPTKVMKIFYDVLEKTEKEE